MRTLTHRGAVVVLSLALVGSLAGTAQAATRVRASGRLFRPKSVSINRGGKVVWRATSGNHTVTAYRGDWSKDTAINEGQRTSFTFRRTGRYKYYCTIHGDVAGGRCTGMCGKVVVG